MVSRATSCQKFLDWVLLHKWECQDPINLGTLQGEFDEICKTQRAQWNVKFYTEEFRKTVTELLKQRKYETLESAHLHFLMSIPISDELRADLKNVADVTTDLHNRIMKVATKDGSFKRSGNPITRGSPYMRSNREKRYRYEPQNTGNEIQRSWSIEPLQNEVVDIIPQASFRARRIRNDYPYDVATTSGFKKAKPFETEELEELRTPKIEEPEENTRRQTHLTPQMIENRIYADFVFNQLLILIEMIDSILLKKFEDDIREMIGKRPVYVSINDILLPLDPAFEMLIRGASDAEVLESTELSEFLKLFGTMMLNMGFSAESGIIKAVKREAKKCKKSTKKVSMWNVLHVLNALFLTAAQAESAPDPEPVPNPQNFSNPRLII